VRLPDDARRRLARDAVAWLTTVTAGGGPYPTPVWLVGDGADLLVFSAPGARKVANIGRQPRVAVHLNCSPEGGDVMVITGTARLEMPARPSLHQGFMEKYGQRIAGRGLSAEQFDALSPARIVIRPTGVWRGPGRLADEPG